MRHSSHGITRSKLIVECLEDRRVLDAAGLLGATVILPSVSAGVEIHIRPVASAEVSVSQEESPGRSASSPGHVNAHAAGSVGRAISADARGGVHPVHPDHGSRADRPVNDNTHSPSPPVTPPATGLVGGFAVVQLEAVTTPSSTGNAGATSEHAGTQFPVPVDAPRRELTTVERSGARVNQQPFTEELIESASDIGPSELTTGRGLPPRDSGDDTPTTDVIEGMAAVTSAIAESIGSSGWEFMENPQSAAPAPTVSDVLAAGIPFDLLRTADDLESLLKPGEGSTLQDPQDGAPITAWLAATALTVAAAELTRRHFRHTRRGVAGDEAEELSWALTH